MISFAEVRQWKSARQSGVALHRYGAPYVAAAGLLGSTECCCGAAWRRVSRRASQVLGSVGTPMSDLLAVEGVSCLALVGELTVGCCPSASRLSVSYRNGESQMGAGRFPLWAPAVWAGSGLLCGRQQRRHGMSRQDH
jgi:hypothetical protein